MSDSRSAVRAVLGEVAAGSLSTDTDGDETFVVDGTPGFVQYGRLGDSVPLLTLTCLVAGGFPVSAATDRWVHEQNAGMLLGGIVLVPGPQGVADVLVRYCLPLGGLDAAALRAVLLPVIAAAGDVRRTLASEPRPRD